MNTSWTLKIADICVALRSVFSNPQTRQLMLVIPSPQSIQCIRDILHYHNVWSISA